jgi:hypothetical protein
MMLFPYKKRIEKTIPPRRYADQRRKGRKNVITVGYAEATKIKDDDFR